MPSDTLPRVPPLAPAQPRLPRLGAVAREQLRAAGLALRPELIGLALLLLGFGVLQLLSALAPEPPLSGPGVHARMENSGLNFSPGSAGLGVWLAFLTPVFLWRNEGPTRRDYFWSLPVEQSRHALLRLGAGWAWQMAVIVALLLFGLALAVLTDGELGVMTRGVSSMGTSGHPPSAVYRSLSVPVLSWQWVTPFTAATIAYLIGSVAALASDYPLRWLLGGTIALVLLHTVLETVSPLDVEGPFDLVWAGRFGLRAAMNGERWVWERLAGSGWSLERTIAQPDVSLWLPAMLLWLGAGAAAAYLAAGYRPGTLGRLRRWGWEKRAG